MRIKGKDVVIYSVKVYKNATFVVVFNTEKNRFAHFEISSKYNEADKIIRLFKSRVYFFVGYGSKHYDNLFINFLLKKRDHINTLGSTYFNRTFYDQFVVEGLRKHDWTDILLELKYAQNFDYIDLDMMLCSKYGHHTLNEECFRNNISCSVNVEEDDYIGYDEFDKEYEKLEERCKLIYAVFLKNYDKIELRIEIFDKYNTDVLDNNDSSALNTILLEAYQNENHVKYESLIPTTETIYSTTVRNIVCNDIKFESDEFNEFLEKLTPLLYSSTNNNNLRRFVSYENTDILFAINGIECENNANIFKSISGQKIYMLHIDALDPSVCLRYAIYPERLATTHDKMTLFRNTFDEFLACAIKSPNDSNRKKFFIKGLESIVYNYNSKKSWLYDPEKYAKMKINASLILMMLIEQLLMHGASFILIEDNTLVFKSFIDLKNVIEDWKKKFGFSYEYTECKKFFKYSVYDYFALDFNNKIITHGIFEQNDPNTQLSNIIIKAVRNNLLYNVDIDEMIRNSGNISDFTFFQKVIAPKRFMYKGIPIGNEVMFYVTATPLPSLYVDQPINGYDRYSRMEAVIKGVHMALIENFMLKPNSEHKFNIDYGFYIAKAKAMVQEIKTEQTIIDMTAKDEKTGDNTEDN